MRFTSWSKRAVMDSSNLSSFLLVESVSAEILLTFSSMGVIGSRLRAVSSSWRLRISVFRRVSSSCGIFMGVGDVGWREVTVLYVLPIWERASLI
jgi:hypothetical protein